MNYKFILFLLLILLSFTLNTSAQTVKIEGTVVDFYGAVQDAEVFAVDALNVACGAGQCRSEDSTSDKTDKNGNFEIYIVPPDYNKKYNITITKEDYKTTVKQVTLNDRSQDQSLRTIGLEGTAKLECMVIDSESNRAVEDVKILIKNKECKTGKNGKCIIENVTAETKTIKIRHSDYELKNLVYDLMPGDNLLKINISKRKTKKDYAVSFYTNIV